MIPPIPAIMATDTRLDEFDKQEWRDIVMEIRPDLREEEYDRLWLKFIKSKETLQ